MQMFKKPKEIAVPGRTVIMPAPTVRQPMETDPSILDAAQRTRASALRRKGRLSTILTDQTKAVAGSSGQKLGA